MRTFKATKSLPQFLGSFTANPNGTVAIVFALTLVPVIVAVGSAVDYGRAMNVKRQLQFAADAAALAGASANVKKTDQDSYDNDSGVFSGSYQKRLDAADAILASNTQIDYKVNNITRKVNFGQNSVTVTATAKVPTTLAAFITPAIEVTAETTATFGSGGTYPPLCLLALNTKAPETFRAWGTADLIAPECAVQSHSIDVAGMVTGGSATATAKHFCAAGGHSGSAFTPQVQDNCLPANDPYAGKFDYAQLSSDGVDVAVGCAFNNTLRIKNNTTITAATQNTVVAFCGGIIVQTGATVTFGPGVYKIHNEFKVQAQATVVADGATFYFADASNVNGTKDGYLTVIGGGNLDLKAPTTGPLAGIAMVQPTVSGFIQGSLTPVLTHTIIGGGVINIYGTIYTPQAQVRVTGNGTINDTSTYFSIIADMVELEGNGQLYINAGAAPKAINLPPMPTVGEGFGVISAKLSN